MKFLLSLQGAAERDMCYKPIIDDIIRLFPPDKMLVETVITPFNIQQYITVMFLIDPVVVHFYSFLHSNSIPRLSLP